MSSEMTILQRAVLAIVKEIAREKSTRNVFPGDVLRPELSQAISTTLAQLVEMGALAHRLLSVNKHDAYSIPNTSKNHPTLL